MESRVTHRYLNLPVRNGAPKRRLRVVAGDIPVDEFEIELAPAEPDFWVFLDLAGYLGQPLAVTALDAADADAALPAIVQSDTIAGGDTLYRERLRPQFHFSARRGWINDPNGLYNDAGTYHLFFQHNPYGWRWGNMHWGHAVSRDLVHWEELAEALYPDDMGTMFSGCAVVDWRNTAGFQTGPEPAQVLIYTAAGGTSARSQGRPSVQCLAYSNDRGGSWTKYAGNPVLGHIAGTNRDPKVIWHAPSERWVMALYLDGAEYALFTSPDLKEWTCTGAVQIPGCSECPDFFSLPVDGDPQRQLWVLWAANGGYLLGDFDGAVFTPQTDVLFAHQGNHSYAAQTWSDVPKADGRRLQISWATFDLPDMPFNRFMTFPCALSLRATEDGIRLCQQPVAEIAGLYDREQTWPEQPLGERDNPLAGVNGELFDIRVELAPGTATSVGLRVRGVPVVYDVAQQQLRCRDRSAALRPPDGALRLRLLVDRASIEIFADDGLVAMPMGVRFDEGDRTIALFAEGGTARLRSLTVATLHSAWPQPDNTQGLRAND